MIESQSKLITSIYLAEAFYHCGFSLILGGSSFLILIQLVLQVNQRIKSCRFAKQKI